MKKIVKWVLWAFFALAVIATFAYLWRKGQPQEVSYEILNVSEGDSIRKQLILTGSIVPRDEVAIKPQIAGIISEILVMPGDEVQVGDVIARISVVPEIMQVNNAENSLKQAQTDHERLKAVYERDKELHAKGVVAQEDYERSRAEYENARTRLTAAEEALQIIRRGTSTRLSKESSTQVRATIQGKVLSVPVKVGSSVIQANTFNDGTTIATIANMHDLIFKGNADETEVGKLAKGQRMVLSIGAMPDTKLSAIVEHISPQGVADQSTTLFEIKGALTNVAPEVISLLRSGYSANAEIIISEATGVLSVPEACVTYRADSAFVQVVTADSPLTTEERHIQTGLSDGSKIEVKAGLKAGERIRGNQIAKAK